VSFVPFVANPQYPPRFELVGRFLFELTLRNEPVYDRDTLLWLRQFEGVGLSGDQKRMLAYARVHGGRFTSRNYQEVIKTDIYGASAAIKDMIRKGVARSLRKGSRVYEVQTPSSSRRKPPAELMKVLPVLNEHGRLTNSDVAATLGVSRPTATRLLAEWQVQQWLRKEGESRWTVYPSPVETIAPTPRAYSGHADTVRQRLDGRTMGSRETFQRDRPPVLAHGCLSP
jgi:predicted HTH transcriptional regulator